MTEKQTRSRTTRTTTGQTRAKKAESHGPSVPVLVPEVHVRHIPVPRLGVGHVPVPKVYVPGTDTVRRHLPDPAGNRVLWYGGLAGLAAVGVIGWPVAGVVAAGTYVAEHRARAAAHEGNGSSSSQSGAATKTTRAR